eukprot:scaffold5503_cov142-Pinguiococcus_pyrenoidosus.AAC.2
MTAKTAATAATPTSISTREDKDQPFAKCCVYVPKAPMPLASSVDVEAKEDEEVPITTGHLVKECTLDPAVEASS